MKTVRPGTVLLAIIAAWAGSTARAVDVDLTATNWETIVGWKTTIPIANDANGFLYFDFQTSTDTSCWHGGKCPSMEYLFERSAHLPTTNLGGYLSLRVTVTTTGNPTFHWETENPNLCPSPSIPATVRPLINTLNSGNRWWSEIAYPLAPGTSTLIVPFDPSNWRQVDGHLASEPGYTAQFLSDLTNITALGMTFGGGCTYGHGIYITPTTATARFTVEDYELLPDCPTTHGCPASLCFDGHGGVSSCGRGLGECTNGAELGYSQCYSNNSLQSCPSGQTYFMVACPCACLGSQCGSTENLGCH